MLLTRNEMGFNIKSEFDLDELLKEQLPQQDLVSDGSKALLKTLKELRPAIQKV